MSILSAGTSTTTAFVATGDTNGNLVFQTGATPTTAFTANADQTSSFATSIKEKQTTSATAMATTVNYDVLSQAILYYTSNATANATINIRGSSSVTLNNSMAVGESLSIVFMVTNGGTAYYLNAVQIDGSSITPKWQGGSAPTSGNASSIDAYVFTIFKTASATYTVFASQTKFA